MTPQDLFKTIDDNFDTVIRKTKSGPKLLRELNKQHEADIAHYLSNISPEQFKKLFQLFSDQMQQNIFEHLSHSRQAQALHIVNDKQRTNFLECMSMDEFSTIVDFTTDSDLKNYFKLLRKKDREKVIQLLKLQDNAIGTVMDINVISLHDTVTVEKGIQILQRLRPEQELHRIIYVTDKKNKFLGHIGLEDLVLHKPKTKISEFMQEYDYVARVDDDQEDVALKMRHYQLTSAPVVGDNNYFLGAITASNLVDILEEEASENILRMSAMSTLKHTYFETPFFRLLFERSSILIVLMLAQSFTALIVGHYETLLMGTVLFRYLTMLVSTGGNTSTQTSAVVVQGFASGEISAANVRRFLNREFIMALFLATILGSTAFMRVYFMSQDTSFIISLAVGASIGVVAAISVLLGSAVPFILKKVGLDPAFAAAPFLATGMDILGALIYCVVASIILGTF
jgi:magnesium transporter